MRKCCACINGIKEVLVKWWLLPNGVNAIFTVYTVASTSQPEIYYYKGNEPVWFGPNGIKILIYLSGKVEKLKDLMYSLCPQEGAFYLCK